jgi:hypothetical protein
MFSVRGSRSKPGMLVPLLLLAAAPIVAGCGSSSHSSRTADTKTAPAATTTAAASRTPAEAELSGCKGAVVGTYVQVAEHVNHEAMYGGNAEQAARRVRSSTALATAIASGKRAAIEAVLRRLLAGQIVRIEILEHGKALAQVGTEAAIAPVSGTIPGTSASYVLSTQSADSFVKVTTQVTGAPVVVYSSQKRLAGTIAGPAPAKVAQDGPIDYAGRKYRVTSIGGAVYPSGGLQIALYLPRAALACHGSRLEAQTDTLGSVGERIYRQEAGSPYVRATLRHIEADRSFQRAVASRNTQAIRAAIISFFGAHIHVVRVRAHAVEPSGAQRFLYDLGGPYVLAPVHGEVRSAGKLVGRFSFAIQDDAGYLKLAHLFTGGEVLMRVGPNGTHQVMGTLSPGPASVPDRGPVNYEGHEYEVYSFTGEAFPSGPLRISLLLPNRLPFGEPE